ncbi:unnamed protein product [Agarophyton chilense]
MTPRSPKNAEDFLFVPSGGSNAACVGCSIRVFGTDGKSWLSIFALLLRYRHYLLKNPTLYRLRKALQSTMMKMLMLSDENIVNDGNTTRQWIVNLILTTTALFLVLSYEASMTASLVQESIEAQFESTADLLYCRMDPSDICLLKGGALEKYWEKSIAIDKCHFENPPKYFFSYQSLFEAVDNHQCKYAVIIESAVTSMIRNRYCGKF